MNGKIQLENKDLQLIYKGQFLSALDLMANLVLTSLETKEFLQTT